MTCEGMQTAVSPGRDTNVRLLRQRLNCDDRSDSQPAAIRALLDAAFDGDFSDDDWAHALGGTHALIEAGGAVIAHASVVPRVLDVGTQPVRAGYVEAVAVLPARQGKDSAPR